MDVSIVRATEDDVPAIAASVGALFREDGGRRDPLMDVDWPAREGAAYYVQAVADERALALVAVATPAADGAATGGRQVVGHLIGRLRSANPLRPEATVVELESMRVDEQHRDNQVGARLVSEFLAWGRDRGANRASVTAYCANAGAIRFYEAHGFAPFHLELERDL